MVKNALTKYYRFFTDNYRYFLSAGVFYALWLIFHHVESTSLALHSFDKRMIGIATLDDVSVSARVFLFYQSITLFFMFNMLLGLIAMLAARKSSFFEGYEWKVISYTALAGIPFFYFKLLGTDISLILHLIASIQLVAVITFMIRKALLKNGQDKSIGVSLFAIILTISFSLFFFLKEMVLFFHKNIHIYPAIMLCLTAIILFTVLCFFLKNKNEEQSDRLIIAATQILVPFAFIPFLSFLNDEIYLILNNNGHYLLTPAKIYVLLFFLLLCWTAFRAWKVKRSDIKKTTIHDLLAKRYFPLLVIGLATCFHYMPIIKPSKEMFELSNRLLPLLEWHKFGTIPLVQKLNTHMISEIFFSFIYLFFSGLHGQSSFVYDFIFPVLTSVLSYYLLYQLFGNPYKALFFVLFFPLSNYLFPDYFGVGLAGLFVLEKFIRSPQSLRTWLLLLFSALFFLFWRVDIGYPVLYSYVLILLLYSLADKDFKLNYRLALKAAAIIASIALLFTGWVAIFKHVDVVEKAHSFFTYLASSQSFGYENMGNSQMISFKLHYFVFPAILTLLMGYMLLQKRNKEELSPVILNKTYIALFFLIIFYLVNFQRGMVRHGFREGMDTILSSFGYLVIAASVYVIFPKKTAAFKFMLFTIISILLITNYNFPAYGKSVSVYTGLVKKYNSYKEVQPQHKRIDRCYMSPEFKKEVFADFKSFMDKNLQPQQTFIEFSNDPMLYYYTERATPCYFYQSTLSVHDDYLQKQCIKDWQTYSIPFAVVSKFPEDWWDNVDGVPVPVRHYRMAEYIYSHYHPSVIVQNYCTWERNDTTVFNNKADTVYSNKISSDNENAIHFKIAQRENKKYIVHVEYRSSQLNNPGFSWYKASTPQQQHDLKPVYVNKNNKEAFFLLPDNAGNDTVCCTAKVSVGITRLNVVSGHYIPDIYSGTPRYYHLKYLPYVWANYDKSIGQAKQLAKLSGAPKKLVASGTVDYNLPASIDKSTGNYILLKLKNTSDKEAKIALSYGNADKTEGTYSFIVPPAGSDTTEQFAIRMSFQYNWYAAKNSRISLKNISDKSADVVISEVSLLKGD